MKSDDPISGWIDGLRQGDESAARRIWQHFSVRLCDEARHRIHPRTRRVYDEEDAATSAFHSLCKGVAAGRFPDLNDRESLWRLMLVITSRKITRRHRHDRQQRRDVQRNLEESVFCVSSESGYTQLEQFASREPTPEFQAEFVETSIALFQNLDDPALREIAELKIEGYGDSEIADRLNCSRQAVQRKIERIRRNWKKFRELNESLEEERAESDESGIGR